MWNVPEERRYAHRILVGKPEGKRQIGRPRCGREDNIKIESLINIMWGMD